MTQIDQLEEVYRANCGHLPGTAISRVLVDNVLFEERGLPRESATGREATLVWVVGVGALAMAKTYFYGVTLEAAASAALIGLTASLTTAEGRRHFKTHGFPASRR